MRGCKFGEVVEPRVAAGKPRQGVQGLSILRSRSNAIRNNSVLFVPLDIKYKCKHLMGKTKPGIVFFFDVK